MPVDAKICGINATDAMTAAVEGGAAYVGLVFYAPSPRHVSLALARELAALVPERVIRTGLFVDAEDAEIDAAIEAAALGLLQLHGAETPARVAAIRERTGVPVMKAIRIAGAADLDTVPDYEAVCERLLFDAQPPQDMPGALPGGNALSFDWELLRDRDFARPWMLSGGLDADNLADAVRISGARAVDVSSGVESSRGVKDPARIRAFLAAAAAL
jgi:phosphoribosylanthranilate isomerase